MKDEILLRAYATIEMRRRRFQEYIISKLSKIIGKLNEKMKEKLDEIIDDVISDMDADLFLSEDEKKQKKILYDDSLSHIDVKELENVFMKKLKEKAPDLALQIKL